MATPFECFTEYVALKSHFSGKYDYFKYGGKTNIKQDTFEKRNDKYFFQKLAKRVDYKNFIIANLIENDKVWIGELLSSAQTDKIFKEWSKRQQSLTYMFTQDLQKLPENFNENLMIYEDQHPILLRKYLSKEISLETICIILKLTNADKMWNKRMVNDIIWETVRLKIEKYTPFIDCDYTKMKKIVVDSFTF